MIEQGLHYNWHRFYDPTTGIYTQPDPLGFIDGPSIYAYAGNNPVMNTDREGLECSAIGNTVTCNPGSGKPFSFPRPTGWPDDISPNSWFYHSYDIEIKIPSGMSPDCIRDYIKNHPTPGDAIPASSEGSANDASPTTGGRGWLNSLAGGVNLVNSYIRNYSANGDKKSMDFVVNVTEPKHKLFPGYVARSVRGNTIHNYGEGTGFYQADSSYSWIFNNIWHEEADKAFKYCSCNQ